MCKLGQNRRNKHGHKPKENGGFGKADIFFGKTNGMSTEFLLHHD